MNKQSEIDMSKYALEALNRATQSAKTLYGIGKLCITLSHAEDGIVPSKEQAEYEQTESQNEDIKEIGLLIAERRRVMEETSAEIDDYSFKRAIEPDASKSEIRCGEKIQNN